VHTRNRKLPTELAFECTLIAPPSVDVQGSSLEARFACQPFSAIAITPAGAVAVMIALRHVKANCSQFRLSRAFRAHYTLRSQQ